jgi:hypothetical protein
VTTAPAPTETIYVRLLDEGTVVWRPTQGRKVGPMTFQVLPTPRYDPKNERWEFVPGRVVNCRWEERSGGPAFIACEPAAAPADLRAHPRSVVEFVGRRDPDYAPWIDTVIDGKPLEQIVATSIGTRTKDPKNLQGSDPHMLLPPHGNLPGGLGRIQPLLCSGCREPGCHPVSAAIEVFDDVVVWSEFEEGNVTNKLPSIGPFVFHRKQYEAAVARAVEWDAQLRSPL